MTEEQKIELLKLYERHLASQGICFQDWVKERKAFQEQVSFEEERDMWVEKYGDPS